MTRRLAAILILCGGMLEACGGQVGGNSPAPTAPAANAVTPAAPAPGNDAAADADITAAWLTGSWQADNPQCEGDAFFTLAEGGGYTFMEEQGRWSLAGDALTIEIIAGGEDGGSRPGDRHTTRVRRIGADEAQFTTEQGISTHVYRCRGAR